MHLVDLKVMRGPNYWSSYRKELIVTKLDLEKLEEFPTNKIDGFAERLETVLPGLYEHRCSEKKPGGFFERVRRGTWIGHVIEHIALELQSLAGMQCGYGRTRSTHERGVYHVVFAYEVEQAGIYAAHAAIRIADSLIKNTNYDINADIQELTRLKRKFGLGPTTNSIINEAKKRKIPYQRLDGDSLILLGQGVHQKLIRTAVASTTSSIGMEIASDKEETKRILEEGFIPVPKGVSTSDAGELEKIIEEIGFPITIKPYNGNHGRGITTNISSTTQAERAFQKAQKVSSRVIVEKFIDGHDYRLLVVNYKFIAAARRVPAMVMGDGKSTIEELIEEINKDPNRGNGHESALTIIKPDDGTSSKLQLKNLSYDSVLPKGETLFLKDTANLSSGGTACDVTDLVHPYTIFLAERIARLVNLDICGIDIMAKDISLPLKENNGAVLEVNAGPGFRMHLAPTNGTPRNVAEPVIDMLFPPGSKSRIPIVAVTGTNGKTTTTRLIAHMAKCFGHHVGYTTSDGIYIDEQLIHEGDCSGPASAQVILRDPLVDFAVLECARGGILRNGLGFDKCDIAIVTNVTEDHLGLGDIETLEELASVKAVVPNSAFDEGWAILNADDDLVYGMKKDLDCNIALFSMCADNPRVKRHCEKDGLSAIIDDGYFTLCKGKWKTRIAKVKDIPLTVGGRSDAMIQNILPAILTAAARNIPEQQIFAALESFIPTPESTPGRMNLFKFPDFELMIDYAHNIDGFHQLKKFMSKVKATVKVGIIASPGDRRSQDIRNLGYCAAQMFDEIIIRHDKDGRGRSCAQLTKLLKEGIRQVDSARPVTVISDESEAIRYAIDHAQPGSFIAVCTDEIEKSIGLVRNAMEMQFGAETNY